MPLLVAEGLSKSFGEQVLFERVSLAIEEREHVGLVGRNGTGKSSLARVLAGIEAPDAGTVTLQRGSAVGYLAQDAEFAANIAVADWVVQGRTDWCAARDAYEGATASLSANGVSRPISSDALANALAQQQSALSALEHLGGWDVLVEVQAIMTRLRLTEPQRLVASLSGGERRRAALARLLFTQPALAILDEPTNHLDAETIEWLETYLTTRYDGALLLITHDRYVLDRVVDRTLELAGGSVFSYGGGWGSYLEAKALRLEQEAREEANRVRFLRKELDWLSRSPKARTGKQKARIKRAQAAESAGAPAREAIPAFVLDVVRAGKVLVELRDLSLQLGERTLVRDANLIVGPGDRLGIVGPNGCGKTTLLKAVLGDVAPASGRVIMGKTARIGYFDQQRSGLQDDKSIQYNVAGDREKLVFGERVLDVRSYLKSFAFDPKKQRQTVGSLSGGERARVALAKMLLEQVNLVILDEPTNDLDVDTLNALEEMLLEMNAAALIVSHDRYFLDRVATGIVAFGADGLLTRYAGGYHSYRDQVAELEEAAAEQAAALAARETAQSSNEQQGARFKNPRTLTYAERLELDGLFAKIEAAEAAVTRLEHELGDPATYASRPADVPELAASLQRARDTVAELTSRWEELERKQAGSG